MASDHGVLGVTAACGCSGKQLFRTALRRSRGSICSRSENEKKSEELAKANGQPRSSDRDLWLRKKRSRRRSIGHKTHEGCLANDSENTKGRNDRRVNKGKGLRDRRTMYDPKRRKYPKSTPVKGAYGNTSRRSLGESPPKSMFGIELS